MMVVGTIQTNRKDVGNLNKMDGRESQTTKVYWEKEKRSSDHGIVRC